MRQQCQTVYKKNSKTWLTLPNGGAGMLSTATILYTGLAESYALRDDVRHIF